MLPLKETDLYIQLTGKLVKSKPLPFHNYFCPLDMQEN